MARDVQYRRGYAAGYADGVKDAARSRVKSVQTCGMGDFPVKGMSISQRGINCLISAGCTSLSDVTSLSSEQIFSMRNVGKKTAGEIARWLNENGILDSAWNEYL